MAEQITYLIIGNGIAGVTAAEILRIEDSAATIGVIADDPFPVYYRPALKDYLAGRVREGKLWARPSSFYQDQNILFLADRVVGIQPGQHTVQLQSKKKVSYQKLLLANGARPATLKCPGRNLNGVTTLRTVADYQAVLQQLNQVKRVVVSGSGTLALETVETLRHRGFAVSHLLRKRTLWSDVLDATASDLVLQQELRDGVDVSFGEEIIEITGEGGQVNGVITSLGRRIECEMVLIAIGIEPIIDFIKPAGITCGRGVRVDSKMRTNVADIYAAGDVLETTIEAGTGRSRVLGQWYPAIQQARAAAYSMLDLLENDRPFNASTFYNATFLYGLEFASVGLTNASGYQEIVADPKPRNYRKVLLKDAVPVGMIALGDRKQALAFKRAIDNRVSLLPVLPRLFEDDFKLKDWLDSQGVPPPLLGVTRAGDTVVRKAAFATRTDSVKDVEKTVEVSMSTYNTQQSTERTEAILVHIGDPGLPLRLSETSLSQTKVMTIGRQAGVHLLVDEASVSRRHAEISYVNGQYVLRDLGSTNGTFVNDVRLAPSSARALTQNDQLRIGNIVKFRFLVRTLNLGMPSATVSLDSSGAVGVTKLNEIDPALRDVPLGQPVLNSDGSLQPPGSANAVPASVVATFKEAPALIIMPDDATRGGGVPPQVYLLRPGKRIMIGREEGNDIELADVVVSRRHAEIFPGPDGFYIRDLGSSNGVMVNQTKIDNPYRLSHGDRIMLGGTMIFFVDLQAGQEKTALVPALVGQAGQAVAAGGVNSASRANSNMTQRVQGPPVERVRLQSGEHLVICRKCGVANTVVARFCAGCSAPLPRSS